MPLTRRQFLRYSGTGALALSAVPLFDPRAIKKFLASPGAEAVGILVDTTKCVGCRACQLACKAKNNLPEDASALPLNRTYPPQLSATTFSLIEFYRVGGTDPNPDYRTVKKQCMHCLEPACASVCPVGAITKTAKGPVVYDAEKCMGCRYCMAACPFNVPKFEWSSSNPRIRKCTLCADLIDQGKQPACVEACPTKALLFGTRAELIAIAQARINAAPSASKNGAPASYYPYIYGLNEVGGTSVLYLSNVPFDKLGFNVKLPKTPLPDLTWQVMEKIPGVALGVGALMGALAWVTHRRQDASHKVLEAE